MCGMTNIEDAVYSSNLGADIIGVVMAENSPRKGSSSLIRQIASRNIVVAGVYTNMKAVIDNVSDETYVQLHFQHGEKEIEFVREELGKKTISVVFPGQESDYSVKADNLLVHGTDMVLVDFGSDISIAEKIGIRDFNGKRVGVAGRIYSDNIETALKFNPYFIDLSSRLESRPGKKDQVRIKKFMEVFKSETAPL